MVALTIAGLALGSRWAGRRADGAPRPLRYYALLEAGIALWAFSTPLLFHLLPRLALLSPAGGVPATDLAPGTFAATALLLLPGTFLMGATTPFLVRYGSRHWKVRQEAGGSLLGLLYGSNTLGGAAGSLSAVFLLLPRLGMARTLQAAALLDFLVAAVVFGMPEARFTAGPRGGIPRRTEKTSLPAPPFGSRFRTLALLLAVGSLGGICQVAWTRLLVLLFGSSTHALGMTLAACLTALALGSAWAGRRLERPGQSPGDLVRSLLLALAATTVVSVPLWGRVPALIVLGQNLLGGSFGAALALQAFLCLLLLFPSAFALGALLPALTARLGGGGNRAGRDSGDGYGLDSWGSVLGALLSAFLIVPGLGTEWTLRIAGLVAGLLLLLLGLRAPWKLSLLPSFCLILLLALPRWDPVLLTSGPLLYSTSYGRGGAGLSKVEQAMRGRGTLRFLEEGPDATVTVREGAGGVLSLQINGKTDASSGGDLPSQVLAGRLPTLLHVSPRRVLVIGLASGTTAAAAAEADSVKAEDCVEISPGVSRAAPLFSAYNHRILEDPRFHLQTGDGRAYLQRTGMRYDVITSQPTNPWIAGVTNLFTLEFFRLARDRLAEGGVLAVWLQGYALDPSDFRDAVATFLRVFPEAQLWEESAAGGDFFLIGRKGGEPPDANRLGRRLRSLAGSMEGSPWPEAGDLAGFLSRFVAGPRGLASLSRGASLVTDDNLRLEFSAPRALWAYRMPELIASLEEIRESPLLFFPGPAEPEAAALRARLEDLESRRKMRIRLALSLRRADYEAFSSPELSAATALLREGLPDAALPFLRKATALAPGAPALLLLQGWIFLDRGATEEAGRVFREARRLDPASAEAANGEGLAAWRSGEAEHARSLFLQAAGLAPGDPEPSNNLASVLLSEGNEKEALLWLDRVLAARPRYVPAKINRGVALARLGRIEEAVAEYRQALALDPENADASYNLARAMERMRDGRETGLGGIPERPDPPPSGKP